MEKIKKVIVITCILITGVAFSALAQKRPNKTASAKAYYGHKPDKPNYKAKRTKKYSLKKPAKNKVRARVVCDSAYREELV